MSSTASNAGDTGSRDPNGSPAINQHFPATRWDRGWYPAIDLPWPGDYLSAKANVSLGGTSARRMRMSFCWGPSAESTAWK